jgi:hypothetical protein
MGRQCHGCHLGPEASRADLAVYAASRSWHRRLNPPPAGTGSASRNIHEKHVKHPSARPEARGSLLLPCSSCQSAVAVQWLGAAGERDPRQMGLLGEDGRRRPGCVSRCTVVIGGHGVRPDLAGPPILHSAHCLAGRTLRVRPDWVMLARVGVAKLCGFGTRGLEDGGSETAAGLPCGRRRVGRLVLARAGFAGVRRQGVLAAFER